MLRVVIFVFLFPVSRLIVWPGLLLPFSAGNPPSSTHTSARCLPTTTTTPTAGSFGNFCRIDIYNAVRFLVLTQGEFWAHRGIEFFRLRSCLFRMKWSGRPKTKREKEIGKKWEGDRWMPKNYNIAKTKRQLTLTSLLVSVFVLDEASLIIQATLLGRGGPN